LLAETAAVLAVNAMRELEIATRMENPFGYIPKAPKRDT
jgi:hypothetical protein